MFEHNAQEFARHYGALVLVLPFVPSLAAVAMGLLIVPAGQRLKMAGVALAATMGCFGVLAVLLPWMESSLPAPLLRWEAPFILFAPAVVTLGLAVHLRGLRLARLQMAVRKAESAKGYLKGGNVLASGNGRVFGTGRFAGETVLNGGAR
jgi:hypothetical protein